MISGDEYEVRYIKGKGIEELQSEIRELKKRIKQLKKSISNPDLANILEPSGEIQLEYTQKYPEKAIFGLKAAGGTYTPSKAELYSEKFNRELDHLTQLLFWQGDFNAELPEHNTYRVDLNTTNEPIQISKKVRRSTEEISAKRMMADGDIYKSRFCDLDRLHYRWIDPADTNKHLPTADEFRLQLTDLHMGEWKSSCNGIEAGEEKCRKLDLFFEPDIKPIHFNGRGDRPWNLFHLTNLLDDLWES